MKAYSVIDPSGQVIGGFDLQDDQDPQSFMGQFTKDDQVIDVTGVDPRPTLEFKRVKGKWVGPPPVVISAERKAELETLDRRERSNREFLRHVQDKLADGEDLTENEKLRLLALRE